MVRGSTAVAARLYRRTRGRRQGTESGTSRASGISRVSGKSGASRTPRLSGIPRSSGAALGALLFLCLLAAPSRAFEPPGLEVILGTGDPLVPFPDSLAIGFFESGVEAREIYRSRRGSQLHDYGSRSAWVLALQRIGATSPMDVPSSAEPPSSADLSSAAEHGSAPAPASPETDFGERTDVESAILWVGARYGWDRLFLRQRDVHGLDDALDGGREREHVAAAVAGAWNGWQVRGLAGALTGDRGDPEGAIELRGSLGPFDRAGGRIWVWRSSLEIDQRVGETTFHFPFTYREEAGALDLTTRPLLGWRATVEGRHQRVVGDETDPELYNLLYVRRWRGRAQLFRDGATGPDLSVLADRATFDVAMALDGTRYFEAHDARIEHRNLELGWRVPGALRFAAGTDRWELASDDASYLDAWPFTVWDIFTSTRYRLESIDKLFRVDYLRASWGPRPTDSVELNLDARLEFWSDRGSLQWKERVPVLPPFFFRFDHHESSLDWSPTHAVQLDVQATWRVLRELELDLYGQSLVPFGRDGGGHSETGQPPEPPPEAESSAHESVFGGVKLGARLRSAW